MSNTTLNPTSYDMNQKITVVRKGKIAKISLQKYLSDPADAVLDISSQLIIIVNGKTVIISGPQVINLLGELRAAHHSHEMIQDRIHDNFEKSMRGRKTATEKKTVMQERNRQIGANWQRLERTEAEIFDRVLAQTNKPVPAKAKTSIFAGALTRVTAGAMAIALAANMLGASGKYYAAGNTEKGAPAPLSLSKEKNDTPKTNQEIVRIAFEQIIQQDTLAYIQNIKAQDEADARANGYYMDAKGILHTPETDKTNTTAEVATAQQEAIKAPAKRSFGSRLGSILSAPVYAMKYVVDHTIAKLPTDKLKWGPTYPPVHSDNPADYGTPPDIFPGVEKLSVSNPVVITPASEVKSAYLCAIIESANKAALERQKASSQSNIGSH